MLRRHATVAVLLLAQPARGVLLSLPAVVVAGFAPAELEEVPSSRDGASAPDSDEEFDEEEPDDVWEDRLERFVTRALNLTKGHGGECAVGTGCGAAAGWLLRKLQGAIVTAAVLSSIGAAGACLLCTRCGPGLRPTCNSLRAFLSSLSRALSLSFSSLLALCPPAPRPRRALSALLRPRRALLSAPASLLSLPTACPHVGGRRAARRLDDVGAAAGSMHAHLPRPRHAHGMLQGVDTGSRYCSRASVCVRLASRA
jgi:hypothetical protein